MYFGTNRVDLRFVIPVLAVIAAIVIGVCVLLFRKQTYTADVNRTQWVYTVEIQEKQLVHETGKSSCPTNARNVVTHHDLKSYVRTDSNGNKYTECKTVITYDYDVPKWVRVREYVNAGTDNNPSYKEYPQLKESDLPDEIGAERALFDPRYYAYCTYHGTDEQTEKIEIQYDVWENLHPGDQLVYEQSLVGKPKGVHIAQ